MPDSTPEAPIACTLSRGDLRTRKAWIADLNRTSLLGHRRDDLRLELAYVPDAVDRVLEMVRREQACCAFLAFDVSQDADAIRVVITAPETARIAAGTVFEAFLSRRATPASNGRCCAST